MSCRTYEETIATSLDFELTRDQEVELDLHLSSCLSCRRLMEDLRADRQELTEPVPWDQNELEAIRHQVVEEIALERSGGSSRWLAWAALLLLAVGLAWLNGSARERNPLERVEIAQHEPWSATAGSEGVDSPGPWGLESVELPLPETTRVEESFPEQNPAPRAQSDNESSREATEPRESMLIQLASSDPDLVIYWLIGPLEDNDATSTT